MPGPVVWEQRKMIAKCYTSASWVTKVSLMSDKQVLAVFLSFKRRGLIQGR